MTGDFHWQLVAWDALAWTMPKLQLFLLLAGACLCLGCYRALKRAYWLLFAAPQVLAVLTTIRRMNRGQTVEFDAQGRFLETVDVNFPLWEIFLFVGLLLLARHQLALKKAAQD